MITSEEYLNSIPRDYGSLFSGKTIDYFINEFEAIEDVLFSDCSVLFFLSLPSGFIADQHAMFVFNEERYKVFVSRIAEREINFDIKRSSYSNSRFRRRTISRTVTKKIGRLNKISIIGPENLLSSFERCIDKIQNNIEECYDSVRHYFTHCFADHSPLNQIYRTINKKIESSHKSKKLLHSFGMTITEMVDRQSAPSYFQYYFDKLFIKDLFDILISRASYSSAFETFRTIYTTKAKDLLVEKITDTDVFFKTEFNIITDSLYPKDLKDAEGIFFNDKGFGSFDFGRAKQFELIASFPLKFEVELVPLLEDIKQDILNIFNENLNNYGTVTYERSVPNLQNEEGSDVNAVRSMRNRSIISTFINSLLPMDNGFQNLIV